MPFQSNLVVMDQDPKDVPHLMGSGRWELHEPLVYRSEKRGFTITIPAGYVCDMASVPRIPIVWEYCGACAQRAAVVHDFGCEYGFFYTDAGLIAMKRFEVDAVFLEAMRDSGVGPIRRGIMYTAVYLFGLCKSALLSKGAGFPPPP